jgi:hypothetical protein
MTENEIGKIVVDTALAVHRDSLDPDSWKVLTRLFWLGSCSCVDSLWSDRGLPTVSRIADLAREIRQTERITSREGATPAKKEWLGGGGALASLAS